MADPQKQKQNANQGEGNRTADEAYRKGASAHASSDAKVKQAAEQAKRALENEGEALAAAEVDGKSGPGAGK
jgi:hypothetical protein